MKDAIVEIFEGQQITIRPSDGYWNATEMCKRYDRKVNDFTRLKGSKDYLAALSLDTGIPVSKLLATILGRNLPQGTWVHPQVALKMAAWLNPYFEVWVFRVIERLLTQGRVELQDAYDSLKAALEASEEQVREVLARSERLQIDLSRLGDEYAIDDISRDSEAAAWAEVARLREKLIQNGIDPHE